MVGCRCSRRILISALPSEESTKHVMCITRLSPSDGIASLTIYVPSHGRSTWGNTGWRTQSSNCGHLGHHDNGTMMEADLLERKIASKYNRGIATMRCCGKHWEGFAGSKVDFCSISILWWIQRKLEDLAIPGGALRLIHHSRPVQTLRAVSPRTHHSLSPQPCTPLVHQRLSLGAGKVLR